MQLVLALDVDIATADDPATLVSTLQDGTIAYLTSVAGVTAATVATAAVIPDPPADSTSAGTADATPPAA